MITLHFYKNVDNYDDFKQMTCSEDNAGQVICEQQRLGWYLDKDEYDNSKLIFLLALKQDYMYDKIIEDLHSYQDTLTNMINKYETD